MNGMMRLRGEIMRHLTCGLTYVTKNVYFSLRENIHVCFPSIDIFMHREAKFSSVECIKKCEKKCVYLIWKLT